MLLPLDSVADAEEIPESALMQILEGLYIVTCSEAEQRRLKRKLKKCKAKLRTSLTTKERAKLRRSLKKRKANLKRESLRTRKAYLRKRILKEEIECLMRKRWEKKIASLRIRIGSYRPSLWGCDKPYRPSLPFEDPNFEFRGFVSVFRLFDDLEGPRDNCTTKTRTQILSKSFYDRILTGPESNYDAEIRSTLLHDLAVQPLLAKTYAVLFPKLINIDLPDCKRWKNVLSASSRTLRNALKKVRSRQSTGPNIGVDWKTDNLGDGYGRMDGRPLRGEMDFSNYPQLNKESWMYGSRQRGERDELTRRCLPQQQPRSPLIQVSSTIVSNGLDILKRASILTVGIILSCNIPTAESRSLQANKDIEKTPDFWFGLIQTVAALFTVIGGLIQINKWRRRHSSAGTSAASAPAGPILNHAESSAQKLTVLRLLRKTEHYEVLVARRD